jgi:MFS transporter, FHS family, L-fucose permease
MNPATRNNYLFPLIIIGFMFFAIGFAWGINSYLVPLLHSALDISSGQAYLVIGANFIAFLLFSYPAGLVIQRIGYRNTMAGTFLLFALGFYLFIPSARLESLNLFLLGSFLTGVGNAFLQASINPYVTIMGPIESAAKRISIMGICNKLAWPVSPLFLTLVINKSVDEVVLQDINLPFYIIIGVFLLVGLMIFFSSLPEVKAAGEDPGSIDAVPYAANKTRITQFPHFILAVIALFLYVGAEITALSTLVDYAVSLDLPNPSLYAWIAPAGMVIGYICGIIAIPKYISQAGALVICSIVALTGAFLVVLTPGHLSIWFISLMALGASLMWPAIYPLALSDLGKFTKMGGSILIIGIFGGAVFPTLYGVLKDYVGSQNAYWLTVPCFLFILYYALHGHRIRTS